MTAWVGVLFVGAIFGFFYAWVCSTMWGLDDADPRVAIAAMQAMNDSVRNAVFFPAFFLTPVVLGLAAALAWRERRRASGGLLLAAALVYLARRADPHHDGERADERQPSPTSPCRPTSRRPARSGATTPVGGSCSTSCGPWPAESSLGLAGAALVLLHRRSDEAVNR